MSTSTPTVNTTAAATAAADQFRGMCTILGYPTVAVGTRDKRPVDKGWTTQARAGHVPTATPDALSTGILCDGLYVVDFDIEDANVVEDLHSRADTMLGKAPVRYRDNSPRRVLVYRAKEGQPSKKVLKGTAGSIEILGYGQQFVAHGVHPSGADYKWLEPLPLRGKLPAVSESKMASFLAAAGQVIGASAAQAAKAEKTAKARKTTTTTAAPTASLIDTVAALAVIPNDDLHWEDWNNVIMAIWRTTGGSAEGLAAAVDWSAKSSKHDPTECQYRWEHFHVSPPTQIGFGSLWQRAKDADPTWQQPSKPRIAAEDEFDAEPMPAAVSKAREKAEREKAEHGAEIARRNARDVARQKFQIFIGKGRLYDLVEEAEEALVANDADLFVRGGMIVKVTDATLFDRRTQSRVTVKKLVEVNDDLLRLRMTEAASFKSWVQSPVTKSDTKSDARTEPKGEWKDTNCPKDVAEAYLSKKGDWKLRALSGLTNTPLLSLVDGSVMDKPGYDPDTGMFFDPRGLTFPPIKDKATKGDATAALGRLKGLLAEFPFADTPGVGADASEDPGNVSRAVALSAMLTAVVRPSFANAPMHAINGTVPGSGKGYLTAIVAMLQTGMAPGAISVGGDDTELEKRLSALLLAGRPLIVLDNVQRKIDGEILNSCITEETVSLRPLGTTSKAPEVDCTAMMMMNGNQLQISGDMTRRCILANLDPRMEQPETKQYGSDPLELVRKDRASYIADCLTIIRAHHIVGHPGAKGLTPFNSFGDWTKWVRGALVWLGEADAVASVDWIRNDDPNREKIISVMFAWGRAFGDKEVTSADVVRLAKTRAYADGAEDEALLDVLRAAAVNKTNSELTSESLGYWLRNKKGREFAGMRFVKIDGKTEAGAVWKLVGYRKLEAQPAAAAADNVVPLFPVTAAQKEAALAAAIKADPTLAEMMA